MGDTPENRARFLATIPLGRLSTDLGNAAAFLCSDEATRGTMEVDGGLRIWAFLSIQRGGSAN